MGALQQQLLPKGTVLIADGMRFYEKIPQGSLRIPRAKKPTNEYLGISACLSVLCVSGVLGVH